MQRRIDLTPVRQSEVAEMVKALGGSTAYGDVPALFTFRPTVTTIIRGGQGDAR